MLSSMKSERRRTFTYFHFGSSTASVRAPQIASRPSTRRMGLMPAAAPRSASSSESWRVTSTMPRSVPFPPAGARPDAAVRVRSRHDPGDRTRRRRLCRGRRAKARCVERSVRQRSQVVGPCFQRRLRQRRGRIDDVEPPLSLADLGGACDAVRRGLRALSARVRKCEEADGEARQRGERRHDVVLGPDDVRSAPVVLEEEPHALRELAAGGAEHQQVLGEARDEDGLAIGPAARRADERRGRRVDRRDLRGLTRYSVHRDQRESRADGTLAFSASVRFLETGSSFFERG